MEFSKFLSAHESLQPVESSNPTEKESKFSREQDRAELNLFLRG